MPPVDPRPRFKQQGEHGADGKTTSAAAPAGDKWLAHRITRWLLDVKEDHYEADEQTAMGIINEVRKATPASQAPVAAKDEGESATSARAPQPEYQPKEWCTVIVGLPIIRKLLNGEDVTIESFHINLIPDDVLWNNRALAEGAGKGAKP
jgi:hypothetical protein